MDLAQEVKRLKKEKGVSYVFIANMLGMKKQNFYKFLKDKNDKDYCDLTQQRKEILRKYIEENL